MAHLHTFSDDKPDAASQTEPQPGSQPPGFQPKERPGEGGQDGTLPPTARPFLDCAHHWAAAIPLPPGHVVSRCRLRIFRNGALGRAIEWAVLITELQAPAERDLTDVNRRIMIYAPDTNPGVPARTCLSDIADQVKSNYLPRAPHEQISWFLHDRSQTSKERPFPHDQLQCVQFNVRVVSSKCVYLNFALNPVNPEQLELAAGGLVEL